MDDIRCTSAQSTLVVFLHNKQYLAILRCASTKIPCISAYLSKNANLMQFLPSRSLVKSPIGRPASAGFAQELRQPFVEPFHHAV